MTTATQSTAVVVYSPDERREIAELMGFKGTPPQVTLLFHLAEHYRLDPKLKEIALIPGKGPFIGVWGRLNIAHRSGLLDGFEADDEWETESGLYCVRCIVWRKDMGHPAAKVVGRVGRHEKKEWPFEIARARAVRAALGYAFTVHDAFDVADEDWAPPPEERLTATVVDAGEPGAVSHGPPAAAGDRPVDPETGEVGEPEGGPGADTMAPGAREGQGQASAPLRTPNRAQSAPEPPTRLVGGHTMAQRLAIVARAAGIEDDETRHDVVTAATGGAYGRGLEVPEDDEATAARLLEAFQGLAEGTVELRYAPDGAPRLFRARRAPG